MGNTTEQDEPDAKRGEGRKRFRERESQTDEETEHVEHEHSTPHGLDAINVKLDKLLATCSEIKTLKNEICGLREELKSVRDSLDFANQEIETLKRRNIKLEAYTGRENIRIFNLREEAEENTERVVRNLLVSKMQIPLEKVKNIRFERVHRIPRKTATQNQTPLNRPNTVIARFSHYQDKEFVPSFYKNLKGTDIGISDDFPREDIHKALYPVLKKARRNQQRAHFNFDKLIIDGRIYRGKETKELPFYGNIK